MPRNLSPSASPVRCADIASSAFDAVRGDQAARRFGDALRGRFHAEHCHLFSSGRAALSALFSALRARTPERDTVSLPAFTSYSVASAAVRSGLKVAFYDLDPATLCPEPGSFERSLGPNVVCAVVCHLFGYPCPMNGLADVAAGHGVPLVDDAAQAMGATVEGRAAGMSGIAGILSLSRGKNITSVDGGVILTNDSELSRAIAGVACEPSRRRDIPALALKALLIWALQRPQIYWLPRSLPFLKIGASVFEPDFPIGEMSPFQAALGRRMFGRLDEINQERVRNAEDIIRRSDKPGRFPEAAPGSRPVYLRLPCLGQAGREIPEMGVVRSYPQALCDLQELRPHVVHGAQDCPEARRLARELVTLPTHCFVTQADRVLIARSVA